jgi:hypothetical protein
MLMAAVIAAQDWWETRPYTTWSREEVDKILNDSPWSREVRKSLPRITLINPGIAGIERAYDRIQFHVGLLTAKPVRMALARRAILLDPSRETGTDWAKYIDGEDTRNIVVILSMSATPAQSHPAMILTQLLDNFKTADLVNQVALASDGGRKVPLTEYSALGENGYGYKFVFPRSLPDGRALVEPGSKELRFDLTIRVPEEQSELGKIAVNAKWDVRKMLYLGRLTF